MEKSHEPRKEWINENWEPIAGLAWAGYLEGGRGAMLIDFEELEGDEMNVMYFSENDIQSTFEGWPDPQLAELVEKYDPETEIVVIFRHPEEETSYYRLGSPNVPPPSAYKSQMPGD